MDAGHLGCEFDVGLWACGMQLPGLGLLGFGFGTFRFDLQFRGTSDATSLTQTKHVCCMDFGIKFDGLRNLPAQQKNSETATLYSGLTNMLNPPLSYFRADNDKIHDISGRLTSCTACRSCNPEPQAWTSHAEVLKPEASNSRRSAITTQPSMDRAAPVSSSSSSSLSNFPAFPA